MKPMRTHFATIVALAAVPLFAQEYQPSPLQAQNRNPVLQQLTVGENIGDLSTADIGLSAFWATSFLPPEGKPPTDNPQAYDSWTEMYGPRKASDGDTRTAWAEGVEGPGSGQVLVAKVDTTKPVSIWSGFGKSPRDFTANSRPRAVRVWVLQANGIDVGESGQIYKDVRALASLDVELKDLNGWQTLPTPKHSPKNLADKHFPDGIVPAGSLTFVAIEIVSVYPGSRFADTLISEVANR